MNFSDAVIALATIAVNQRSQISSLIEGGRVRAEQLIELRGELEQVKQQLSGLQAMPALPPEVVAALQAAAAGSGEAGTVAVPGID